MRVILPLLFWLTFGYSVAGLMGAGAMLFCCIAERGSREIHARVYDPTWLAENRHRLGDDFDFHYMKRFGFQEIGCGRKYETMVFKAGAPCTAKGCGCGLPSIDGSELDFAGYSDAASATRGHMAMVAKYVRLSNKPVRKLRRLHPQSRETR